MSASGTRSCVGLVQSTGTSSVAHWKPSPQSDHARVASNAGSGGHVVVVVVVDEDDDGFFAFATAGAAGTASASDTSTARKIGVQRFTARRDRPTGWAARACR